MHKYWYSVLISISGNITLQWALLKYVFPNNETGIFLSYSIAVVSIMIVRFLYDKYVVFQSNNCIKKEFGLYIFTSIITTLTALLLQFIYFSIFKVVDIYAIAGSLIIGYILKYTLDKKKTFKKEIL